MKAILLIDVPDNTEFDKDYRLTGLLLANKYTDNIAIEFKDARLKPMPRKNYKKFYFGNIDENRFVYGWNACIDELLGAEE